MRKNSRTVPLTLCAMCAALSFVIMYMGVMTGVLDMSGAVICGLITVIAVRECGLKMSLCAVLACSVLCFALLTDKTVSILYFFVSGIYPMIKPFAERLKKTASWAVKLAVAAVIILIYIGAIYIFLPTETGKFIIPVGLVFGILCFVLYDILLTRFEVIYLKRLRGLFIRNRR